MLELYRAGLRMRRAAPWGEDAMLRWLPSAAAVLAFQRGDRFTCLVNFGPDPAELPAGAEVLISSNELDGGAVPPDTAVWLRQATDDASTPAPNGNQQRIGQGKEGR
jgi:alpha-glucosidase